MLTLEKIEQISIALHHERKLVDDITLTASRNLMSLLLLLGTLFVPLTPATLTGVSLYFAVVETWGMGVAIGFSFVAAVLFEALGVAGAHATLRLYQDWLKEPQARRYEFIATLLIAFSYVVIVSLTIGFLHELPAGIYQFGMASPVGVVMFYLASNLLFMSEERERQDREVEVARLALEQQRKLAELADFEATLKQARELNRLKAEQELKLNHLEAEQALELRRLKAEEKLKRKAETISSGSGRIDRDRAKLIYQQNPAISGAELGRQLGVSDRSGRNLKRQFEAEAAGIKNGIVNGNGAHP